MAQDEDDLLRSVTLQNAASILLARQRADEELVQAKLALERRSEALAHSLSMMRATLESTTDGILVVDAEGRITEFNENFLRLWRIPRPILESGERRRMLEFIAPLLRDPGGFLARLEEIYASAPPESFDVLELADGRAIERASRIPIVNGRNAGRVWSFRDITERRRVEEARFRLAAVVESSDDAIVSKTLESIIITWNQGAERMFGYTAAEVIGRPITILIPDDRQGEEPLVLERLKRGERIEHYETVRRRKDGTLFNVSLTVSPIRDDDGRIIGASKIARDITERIRAEEERERLASALEKLLQSERSARAEAERLSSIKDDFLATLSHELRTPLSAILGWSQVLRRRGTDDPELRQGLETIERNVRAQTQLIEDLLDMSRITSGKLRLDMQPVEPVSFIEAALETVRPAADAKGVRIEKFLDPTTGLIAGDPNRLQQIVWNLLSNAIKFTPRGGKVQVLLERVNSHVEITVADNGIGIKPEFLPHVFERFRQADASSTRSYGGLGLGLSIVKHLVELHGGSVEARSAGEGRGTTFAVQLPLMIVHAGPEDRERLHPGTPQALSALHEPSNLSGIRVLVVDDDEDARELIRRVLVDCNAEVFTASAADEGLRLVRAQKPHVLLTDIGMPEVDGYEFMRRVRALGPANGGRTPAIALTAFARSEDRTRALRAGFLVHVAKPVDASELVATVASVVGRIE